MATASRSLLQFRAWQMLKKMRAAVEDDGVAFFDAPDGTLEVRSNRRSYLDGKEINNAKAEAVILRKLLLDEGME